MYGKHQAKNLEFLVHQHRPTGAEIGTLVRMASFKLKIPGTPVEATMGRN